MHVTRGRSRSCVLPFSLLLSTALLLPGNDGSSLYSARLQECGNSLSGNRTPCLTPKPCPMGLRLCYSGSHTLYSQTLYGLRVQAQQAVARCPVQTIPTTLLLQSRRRPIQGVDPTRLSASSGGVGAKDAVPPIDFHVAPMQCYTNRYFRTLMRMLSPTKAILWTEMEKATDLVQSAAACDRRLRHDASEHPLILQLGGNDVAMMERAARRGKEYGFTEINLNCGCPSIESGGADYGASLMKTPDVARDVCEALASVSQLPVSVKCRVGVYEDVQELLKSNHETEYQQLADFVVEVSSSGAVKHFVVHARAAVLAGLSPVKNRMIPPLRYDSVRRLAEALAGDVRVTLNGGLWGIQSVRDMAGMRGSLSGIMAGRWLLNSPLSVWDLEAESCVARVRDGRPVRRADAIDAYTRFAVKEAMLHGDGGRAVGEALMPLVLVAEQLKDEEEGRQSGEPLQHGLMGQEEAYDVFRAVWHGVETITSQRGGVKAALGPPISENGPNFRKLEKAMKKGMGTKVANKVFRNRAEDLGLTSTNGEQFAS